MHQTGRLSLPRPPVFVADYLPEHRLIIVFFVNLRTEERLEDRALPYLVSSRLPDRVVRENYPGVTDTGSAQALDGAMDKHDLRVMLGKTTGEFVATTQPFLVGNAGVGIDEGEEGQVMFHGKR